MQSTSFSRPSHKNWLDQVFHCRAVENGGVIRRQIVDVEREVGVAAFLAEVQRRGFRLIRTKHYLVVVCNNGPVEVML